MTGLVTRQFRDQFTGYFLIYQPGFCPNAGLISKSFSGMG
ncbi:hypothetical protein Echvi_3999 [Echinicola vietnamensis DSM 17526]|uniref:Uncharacterized protein n=1 Tax=Echinicola vietnamensis (strain DSM 17526 / LMG 23754 / KMM 6221) TaxID=926556 RepID=L0G5B5_ECHVK|nr:hypothetical protein Echvi_3999 [Echinicola vietnamensis DSM 17526]